MKKIKCYCGHTDYCDCGQIEPQIKANNMKLYTEEQVRLLLDLAKLKINGEMYSKDVLLEQVSPIELPSDEEIEESETNSEYDRIDEYNYGFIDGANWVKDFIINQNK